MFLEFLSSLELTLPILGYGVVLPNGAVWVAYWGDVHDVHIARFSSYDEAMHVLHSVGVDMPTQSSHLDAGGGSFFLKCMAMPAHQRYLATTPALEREQVRALLTLPMGGVTNISHGNEGGNSLQLGTVHGDISINHRNR